MLLPAALSFAALLPARLLQGVLGGPQWLAAENLQASQRSAPHSRPAITPLAPTCLLPHPPAHLRARLQVRAKFSQFAEDASRQAIAPEYQKHKIPEVEGEVRLPARSLPRAERCRAMLSVA